jgi:hypothetical protein
LRVFAGGVIIVLSSYFLDFFFLGVLSFDYLRGYFYKGDYLAIT